MRRRRGSSGGGASGALARVLPGETGVFATYNAGASTWLRSSDHGLGDLAVRSRRIVGAEHVGARHEHACARRSGARGGLRVDAAVYLDRDVVRNQTRQALELPVRRLDQLLT